MKTSKKKSHVPAMSRFMHSLLIRGPNVQITDIFRCRFSETYQYFTTSFFFYFLFFSLFSPFSLFFFSFIILPIIKLCSAKPIQTPPPSNSRVSMVLLLYPFLFKCLNMAIGTISANQIARNYSKSG